MFSAEVRARHFGLANAIWAALAIDNYVVVLNCGDEFYYGCLIWGDACLHRHDDAAQSSLNE